MRVLGIDPGYERVGVAIVDKDRSEEILVFSDCITTSRKSAHSQRLEEICSEVEKLIDQYRPDSMSIETLFFNSNQKTAMKVSEARGAIIRAASKKGIDVSEYTPLEIKIAITGYGRADKSQVTNMVKRLTKVSKLPKYDDVYDAIAIALTHLATNRLSI